MRIGHFGLVAALALTACVDSLAPRPSSSAQEKARETRLSLGVVAPAPSGATIVDTRPGIGFKFYDPCNGDTVQVSGTYKNDGWEYTSDTLHRSDTFGQSDNGMTAVGILTGVKYDVLYFNHQTVSYGATNQDNYVATVHKFWLLTNRDTWKSVIRAQKYTITQPPFVITGDPAYTFTQCYAW